MKRILGVLLLASAAITTTMAQPPKSSVLWEISGNGLQQPSWIFGTVHLLCRKDFTISPLLAEKIKNASAFYGELKMDDLGMQMTAARRMLMTDKSLETLIGEKDYPAIDKKFTEITGGSMSLKVFDHMKPFAAESMLALSMVSCEDRVQPETEFLKIAQENKKVILGLETIEEQMDAIDKQPLDSQVRDLTLMITRYDSMLQLNRQLIDIYKKNNIDSVYHFMKNTGGIGGDYEADLILNRNKKWIPVIEKAALKESIFIAVGAGHLGGPEGVINLLRKRGYRLTPVKY